MSPATGRHRRWPPHPPFAANADFVRLEPALLAVSAERIKQTLWRELGIDSTAPWRGKIFLALHPARSLDENVTVLSEHFADGWDYRVALPDVLSRTRFLRALTGVMLLEFANRGAGARPAEIPAWLTDGLSQQLLATGTVEMVLSSPGKMVNGLPESRTDATQRGMDPLAGARRVLRDHPALTFEQLSWPTDAQVSGDDGGVYRASAQLFVNELLKLKNGPAHLRAMLQASPRYYNWQTAFQDAFRADFAQPLDVEKWWALQVVGFRRAQPRPGVDAGRQPRKARPDFERGGGFSRRVERPARARGSFAAGRDPQFRFRAANGDSPDQVARPGTGATPHGPAFGCIWPPPIAPPWPIISASAVAPLRAAALAGNHVPCPVTRPARSDTLEKLDALDAQRRTVESAIKPDVWRP